LTGIDPAALRDVIQARASARQFRPFTLACCRRIWQLLTATNRVGGAVASACIAPAGPWAQRRSALGRLY
jgi:hypothetical protein